MDYNFHTHTYRCRHASGSDEEYIKSAMEAGIKYLGFSDHAPYIFPDGYENSYRVQMCNAESYVKDLQGLREKYQGQIEISIGFEMEYYPAYFDDMLKIAKDVGTEYLILGQHFLFNEHPNGVGSGGPTDNIEHLRVYVDEIIEAIKSGVFSYIAHPDYMCFTGDEEIYRSEMTRLCLKAKEYDIPLEINLVGIRKKKHYPCDRFWQIAGEVGAPVTIGYDAHSNHDFENKEQLDVAKDYIERYSLNYIGMPRLINIQNK